MRPPALSGGRAPQAWRRGIARAVAPLGALRRSAAWLAGLARVRLSLTEGPLLGRSFHEIASQPFPTAAPRQQEARPAPTRPRFPEPVVRSQRRQSPPVPRREGAERRAGEELRTVQERRSVAEPLALGRQVGRELIERLAGRKDAAERPHPLSPSPISRPGLRPAPAGRGGTPPKRYLDGPASPSQSGPPSPGDGAGGRRERGTGGEVLARFGRALRRRLERLERRADKRVGGALSGAPAPGREGEGSSLAPTSETPSPSLPRFAGEGAPSHPLTAEDVPVPWRLTLAGDAAPRPLLERWAPTLGGATRASRPSPAPSSRNLPAPPRDEAPSPVQTRQPEATETAHQEPTLLPPPPSLPPFLRMNGAGDGAVRHPAAEARSVLAPPAGPAVPPVEDLDALASKIQRILDEEARRHGIPV